MRFGELQPQERTVIMLIDEIYVLKKAEHSKAHGQIFGFVADGTELANTCLCFMLSSVFSKYRDIVALYPTTRLNAAKLKSAFMEVLGRVVTIGFRVLVVCTDNHSANRSFFKELCGGQLKTCIQNPKKPGEPLFLLLDPTHNIKNVYNNWQKHGFFRFPSITSDHGIPGSRYCTTANFNDVSQLYHTELGRALKYAPRLSIKALDPNSVQKTSVKLCLSIFHETTRDALIRFSREDGKPWKSTGVFVAHIVRLWQILNVKTRFLGQKTLNPYLEPISALDCDQLKFLEEFQEWLQSWEKLNMNSGQGLTKPTFLAVGHSIRTLVDLSRYCLKELDMEYVLLGKFQSDALESRFGQYRQMNGGNYYLSVRQLAENERKIRAVSLLKFSKISVEQMKSMQSSVVTPGTEPLVRKFKQYLDMQLPVSDGSIRGSDTQILYYVTGALVRSKLAMRKCDSCWALLTRNSGAAELPYLTVEGVVTPNVSDFLNEINRGGLLIPSDLAFSIGVKCWLVFTCIKDSPENGSPEVKNSFIACNCQVWLFTVLVTRLLAEDSVFCEAAVTQLVCDSTSHHGFCRSLVQRFYNCFAKNFVKEVSGAVIYSGIVPSDALKIAKLQSKSVK